MIHNENTMDMSYVHMTGHMMHNENTMCHVM